jgi:hypothetical protein
MRRHFFVRALKVAAVVTIVLGVVSFVIMSLWNWLVPPVFSGSAITYWQALGLLVLTRLLFGGLHPRGPFGRHPMHRRWMQMTPEERERFREHLHHRWGGPPCGGPPPEENPRV